MKTLAVVATSIFAGLATPALAHQAGGAPHLHQPAELLEAASGHVAGLAIVALLAGYGLLRLIVRAKAEGSGGDHE